MKRILITGANSYIGTSLEKWLSENSDKYFVETLDMRYEEWNKKDFSSYDVIFHVAGIAHISAKQKMKPLYYRVNRDLAIKAAKKAKKEEVKQFIFMSSIIVYGDSSCDKKVITKDTVPNPSNFYGDSKLQAEVGISQLKEENFKIVIIRSPMVYGKNSKGNYPMLSKVAKKIPIFPDIENERSLIHIDNLCEFIRLIIDNEEDGVFFPQNKEYVKISELVQLIAKIHGKKILMTKMFNLFINALCPKLQIISKVFGNMVYEKNISYYKDNYQIRDLRDSIKYSEEDC